MKIEACVCYPVYVWVEVKEEPETDEDIFKLREKIIQEAYKMYDSSSVKPVIREANLPELVD